MPWHQERDREWIPSGVVSYKKMLWWFDLSWGIIRYDPICETAEPLLLFHLLPEGQDLNRVVTTMTPSSSSDQEESAIVPRLARQDRSDGPQEKRPPRPMKLNPRVFGPEWCN